MGKPIFVLMEKPPIDTRLPYVRHAGFSMVRSDAIKRSIALRMGGLVSAIPHIASAMLMSNGMRAHDAGRVAHIH